MRPNPPVAELPRPGHLAYFRVRRAFRTVGRRRGCRDRGDVRPARDAPDGRAQPFCVTYVHMSTRSLRDLRSNLGSVVRTVAATGEEVIVTDSGTEVAVIISMTDYERLHEHADVADVLRLRDLRARSFTSMTLAEMLDALGVDADAFATR